MLKFRIGLVAASVLIFTSVAFAGPDTYLGDTSIYSGAAINLKPNVLFIVDNSSAAQNTASGEAFDPARVYPNNGYDTWAIYKAGQQGEFTQVEVANTTNSLENLTCSVNGDVIRTTLLANGTYSGRGTSDYPSIKFGGCDTKKAFTYALGNYLNYLNETPPDGSNASQAEIVYDALSTVVSGSRYAVNFGFMVYDETGQKGGRVVREVGDLTTDTEINDFKARLPGSGGALSEDLLSSQTSRPQAEALLDAGYYFRGKTLPISGQSGLASPITKRCDKNYIILITNGMSNKDDDPNLGWKVGDYDGDGQEPGAYGTGGSHYLDDVAKYLYEEDASSSLDGTQHIITHTILAFQGNDELVERAADASHGRGAHYNVYNSNELAKALTELLSNIVLEAETSFVAPVVPASPENRTASGKRIYLGFFKPITQKAWHGNLKKYALGSGNQIEDINGSPTIAADGTFNQSAQSYWSSMPDGGDVEAGGTGDLLLQRFIVPGNASDPMSSAAESRNIYTYMGTSNKALTHSDNKFDIDNALIVPEVVGFSAGDTAERDKIIRFVHGLDSFDEDGDTITNERRNWILGDILHSKPLILNYKTYAFSDETEADPSENKTYIFVGANDGMLHAFRDYDGAEEWAFVPPGLLEDLPSLSGVKHAYFVDASPVVYVHDGNNDGTIDKASGDKAILIFGTRRGAGNDRLTTDARGAYYAIDVTDPTSPEYFWSIDSGTVLGGSTPYSEMGETWSVPLLAKVKVGTSSKVVFFIGAGYDNNEDLRYGNNQLFPTGIDETTDVAAPSLDFFNGESATGGSQFNPKGRGVYAVEVATLNKDVSGTKYVPNFSQSGHKVWGYTYANDNTMTYSVPSDITVVDRDLDGYADRLYVGDTGGSVWRFNVGKTDVDDWSAKRLFWANIGADGSKGRKFFYRPATINLDGNTTMVYIGSGDRAHPQNYLDAGSNPGAAVDRFYAIRDRDNNDDPTPPTVIRELNMVDVTENELQQESVSVETVSAILDDLFDYSPLREGDIKYGWYIKLDHYDGEKVLANGSVFNEIAYFTTYTPDPVTATDPCEPGNLGASRLYAVDFQTGEAVYNFAELTGTDVYGENQSSSDNERSQLGSKENPDILRRADRESSLGAGIPSGLVYVIGEDGKTTAITGTGGSFPSINISGSGMVFPVYWKQF